MFSSQRLLLSLLPGLIFLVGQTSVDAADGLRGAIAISPSSASVGEPFRVKAILYNGGSDRVRAEAQIWIVRPWGEFYKLGTARVELRPRQRQSVVIVCRAGREVPVGPHAIGLVIASPGGRFIADTAPIRILPPQVTSLGAIDDSIR